VGGLFFMFIFILGNTSLKEKARASYSGLYLMDLSPKIYSVIFDGFIHTIFPTEKKNQSAVDMLTEAESYKK
jgi:hypothetical protein